VSIMMLNVAQPCAAQAIGRIVSSAKFEHIFGAVNIVISGPSKHLVDVGLVVIAAVIMEKEVAIEDSVRRPFNFARSDCDSSMPGTFCRLCMPGRSCSTVQHMYGLGP
jgi:hypothetical protein